MKLPEPARYFPLEKGVYEVAPGLRTLGTPMGNGARDGQVFQLDSEFHRYRANKLACRRERLGKYVVTRELDPAVESAVARFLYERLVAEHPEAFVPSALPGGMRGLECRLTGERLRFSAEFELLGVEGAEGAEGGAEEAFPPYVSAYDALCSQVQEDVAVMVSPEPGRDWLAALHLCSPSHWAAEDKIGRNFFAVHVPVPGIDKINRAAASFVDAMIRKGPYVRFVWGFATDTRLNHHPDPAPGADAKEWKGRSFEPARPGSPFILRMERQCIVGLPEVAASVFTIRVYFEEGELIRRDPARRALLRSALLSMTPESRAYKGVASCLDEVIAWLDQAGPAG